VRRLRNGCGFRRERLQDLDAEPEHPLAHAKAHAPPDDRRDVRRRCRLDDRLQRLDAGDRKREPAESELDCASPPLVYLSTASRFRPRQSATRAQSHAAAISGHDDYATPARRLDCASDGQYSVSHEYLAQQGLELEHGEVSTRAVLASTAPWQPCWRAWLSLQEALG
jgi:hypothetical protein